MSHFTTLVVLDKSVQPNEVEAKLNEVLAPFDENIDMPEYRKYEEGEPKDHWAYTSVMTKGDRLPDGVREELEEGRRSIVGAGFEVTWEQFAYLYNIFFEYGQPPADNLPATGEENDLDEERHRVNRMYWDADEKRAYHLSTYNPKSKWDWWTIGGRWAQHFPVNIHNQAAGAVAGDIIGKHLTNEDEDTQYRCNGGRRYVLDFDAMLSKAIDKANEDYDEWERIKAEVEAAHPGATNLPWSAFGPQMDELHRQRVEGTLTNEQAQEGLDAVRRTYHAQPLVEAMRKIVDEDGWPKWTMDCPMDHFAGTREDYVLRKRNAAVPGYAMLDKVGQWYEPGKMGWWAMTDETPDSREAYLAEVNRYLAEIDPHDWVVLLDLHI